MKKSWWISLVLPVLLLFIIVGCTSPQTSTTTATTRVNTYPLTVTDQLGRTVTINKIPQRIISLAPSNTEILYALGLADKVVAVTDYDDYPPEVKDKPSIGGLFYT